MRTIRRLLFLTVVGVVGIAAYNHWSDNGWPLRSRAAVLDAQHAKEKAARFANRASAKASNVADKLGDRVSESALTAKIKSKMALDDHVNARAIDVDTSGSVVTLSGTVRSKDQQERALRLARDTEGVTRVVDRLRVQD
jgi:hyperosmotically inducible protein